MKIALLSFEYPPETGFGGIGTYTWHHARGLVALGHEVHVLAGATTATAMRSEMRDGVMVHRYWSGEAAMAVFNGFGRVRFWWTRQRLQNAWSMRAGLAELERMHRFDVVEMPECGAEGALVTRRRELASVVRLHSPAQLIMGYYDVRRGDVSLCSAIERQAIVRAGVLTACSRFVADATTAQLGLNRPIAHITNGLDIDWFDSLANSFDVHSHYGLVRARPIVLFTGRMETRKGIDVLRQIAMLLLQRREVSLVLAGDDLFGHLRETLVPALAQLPLKGSLHCLGAQPNADLRSLVRACDVFLLPSLWENCPYSCLEAMAAGRAVVASRQGGMPELIDDGVDGLLADAHDAAAFVAHIEGLLDDAALRERLGARARAAIERRHSHIEVAQQTLTHYRLAIAAVGEQACR
ncbi:glycosyltransferase family 4 protein [Massilia sp. DWR3-1-1]|uniref:glycosyltransferase family 4 protein n=1 Tax=Massilia sp. DWR3-1-1 TaxID=2804559 RepID=UPI003CE915DA